MNEIIQKALKNIHNYKQSLMFKNQHMKFSQAQYTQRAQAIFARNLLLLLLTLSSDRLEMKKMQAFFVQMNYNDWLYLW